MTLGNILRKQGRSQIWLKDQLESQGISRDKSNINHWCTGKSAPKDNYVRKAIASILNVKDEEINECFN